MNAKTHVVVTLPALTLWQKAQLTFLYFLEVHPLRTVATAFLLGMAVVVLALIAGRLYAHKVAAIR